jgi:NIPSNAP
MKKGIVLILGIFLSLHLLAQNTDSRVFEMRIYYAQPGKLDALVERFQKHTTKIFKKHGMENIGYWVPINNEKNQLIYVLAYPNMEAREASWKAFIADPKWKKVSEKSERNGKIIAKIESVFMKATDFSAAIGASKKGNRVFELRTYTAAPEKLSNVLARFRNHTTALFAKYGMTNIAYWTSLEENAVQPKLIYLLAHNNEEAGKQSFDNFRKDPEWIKVKTESESKGIIVEKIESVYMTALPFSKIK